MSAAPHTLDPVVGSTASSTNANATGDDREMRILSFAELKTLIEQGRTDEIPNNRTISNELNQSAPSETRAAVRKKPWETAQTSGTTV